MAFDLTLTSPGWNITTAKFGQSLNAGYGKAVGAPIPLNADVTIEGWFKVAAASQPSIGVICGYDNGGIWLAVQGDGKLRLDINTASQIGTRVLNDFNWHHFAIINSPPGGSNLGSKLYVDGALEASNATATSPANGNFSIHTFGDNQSYTYTGDTEDFAITSGIKYTGPFALPTAPVADSAPNLLAVWHLDGNGTDTRTADTTKPSVAAAAVANATPTVVNITMTEAMDPANVPAASAFTVSGHVVSAVAISGSQINLTCTAAFVNGEAARTVAYTQPGANNARDLAGNLLDNFTAQAITNNVGASDVTAPTFVTAQVANASPNVIQVTMSEALAASVPPIGAIAVSGGRAVTATSVAGSILSVTVNTAYASTDAVTVAYTQPGGNPRLQDAAGNATATFGAQPVTNNVTPAANNALDTTKMVISPGNWNVGANSLKTVNSGAYLRTLFTGASCKLQFDMTGVTSPPQMYYQIDNGPRTEFTVAASVTLVMPSATADWGAAGGHMLEITYKSRVNGPEVWNPPAVLAALTGIILDAGKTLLLPADVRPIKGLFFGDSITEGQVTVDQYGAEDGTLSYAYALGDILGAEIGVVGFGGQGWTVVGGGNSPVFPTTYNKLYSGVARSFAGLDFIAINHGQNDGGNSCTAAATAVLNGILSDPTLPPACKIIVLRPFSGNRDADLVAAIAACSNPARVSHINTTGFFNLANSHDGIHPYGNEGVMHIAPQVAVSIKGAMAGAAPTTARTVTLNGIKTDATTLATGLAGVKVSFRDAATPDAAGPLSYQSAAQTITGGVLTFSANTTLPSGGVGWLDVKAPGVHFCGPVAVA